MSLVNDALRRAKEAQQQAPPPPPSKMQFRPLDATSHARHNLALLVPAALAVVALLALFFVWQWAQEPRGPRSQEARALTPASPQIGITQRSPSTSVKEVAPARAIAGSPGQSPQPNSPGTTVPAMVESAVAPLPASPANPPIAGPQESVPTNSLARPQPVPPQTPSLRLQAIVFNPKQPSALISGKTVFVGDKLGDTRVVAIDRESATLVKSGQTNVLSLEE